MASEEAAGRPAPQKRWNIMCLLIEKVKPSDILFVMVLDFFFFYTFLLFWVSGFILVKHLCFLFIPCKIVLSYSCLTLSHIVLRLFSCWFWVYRSPCASFVHPGVFPSPGYWNLDRFLDSFVRLDWLPGFNLCRPFARWIWIKMRTSEFNHSSAVRLLTSIVSRIVAC